MEKEKVQTSKDSMSERNANMKLWKEGMDAGDTKCALFYCTQLVDEDAATEETIKCLESLVDDPDNPQIDACAVLYNYYWYNGEEDKAWEWRDKGVELGSPLMEQIIYDEAEEEIGEDDWTESPEKEFQVYDDETEAENPGAVQEKCVIIADVDNNFRIVNADASDWESLPALIDTDRTDDMRCEKFREVSRKLGLPGCLVGMLDKKAFMKPDLELNWHASQWYDGHADLAGDMIICMEDSSYSPFSFSSKEQAHKVIDALCS